MEIQGAHVMVTGASRGIGEAIARAFAAAGARVSLTARSTSSIEALADELGGWAFAADLSDAAQVDGLVARVEDAAAPVDVLVNNAGVDAHALVEDLDEQQITDLAAVNLVAPQRLTRQVLPGMIERGKGHLVYTSSAAASTPSPGLGIYCASKAGLTRFSETVRIETRKTGIGVTTLHLGPVDTDMWDSVTADPSFDAAQRRFRRLGLLTNVTPEKVASDTVQAVEKNRREVRHPKRLFANMALNSAPARLTESLLVGFDARKHRS